MTNFGKGVGTRAGKRYGVADLRAIEPEHASRTGGRSIRASRGVMPAAMPQIPGYRQVGKAQLHFVRDHHAEKEIAARSPAPLGCGKYRSNRIARVRRPRGAEIYVVVILVADRNAICKRGMLHARLRGFADQRCLGGTAELRHAMAHNTRGLAFQTAVGAGKAVEQNAFGIVNNGVTEIFHSQTGCVFTYLFDYGSHLKALACRVRLELHVAAVSQYG